MCHRLRRTAQFAAVAGLLQAHVVRASPAELHSMPSTPSQLKTPRQPPSTHIVPAPSVQPKLPGDVERRRLDPDATARGVAALAPGEAGVGAVG